MGDNRRFDLFASFVANKMKKDVKIADVAAGQGYLQMALREKGFKEVVSFDKRHKHCGGTRRYQWFDYRTPEKFGAVVAMHPDEGTDHAVMYAVTHNVPAFICPCCVKPDAVTYWQSSCDFHAWCKHLEKLATSHKREVTWHQLKMQGRRDVMWIH
jgi:hypothetical protein